MAVIRKIRIMPGIEPMASMWQRVWTHVNSQAPSSTWHHMHDWLQETYDCRAVTIYEKGNKGIALIFDSAEGQTAFEFTWCHDHG